MRTALTLGSQQLFTLRVERKNTWQLQFYFYKLKKGKRESLVSNPIKPIQVAIWLKKSLQNLSTACLIVSDICTLPNLIIFVATGSLPFTLVPI